VAVLVVVALVPAVALGSTVEDDLRDTASQRDRVAGEQEAAEDELARTQEEIAAVARDLQDSQARIEALETALTALRAQLVEAETAATVAASDTRDATDELVRITDRLDVTEGELEGSRRQLDDRVALTWMRGNVDYAGVLIRSATDVSTLVHASYYLETVIDADRGLLQDVTSATLDLERVRSQADDQREAVAAAQARADDQQRQLSTLTASAEELAEAAAEEEARQQGLYDRLEDKQAATRAELVVLEEQSREIEQELDRLRQQAQWRAGRPGTGTFVWPSDGRLSSRYGNRVHPIYGTTRLHAGVDIAGGFGVPVVAANAGLVLQVACTPGGYGCRVVIDHGGGIASLYAHLSSFQVAQGDIVAPGDVIARTGSTGASTGPHLHFEIRVNGVPQDPLRWY
jgi:murein DD-endopeptidase MepM/ murein hydrolase activator NlpD